MSEPAAKRAKVGDAYTMLIDGELVAGATSFPVTNPSLGAVFAQCPGADKAQAESAVAAARKAYPAWSGMKMAERKKCIQVCLDRLAAGTEALAEVLVKEQGKPLSGATGEIAGCGALLKKAIELELPVEVYSDTDECRIETRRAPLGVIACITPWNYPMFCAVQKWAAALVVGNTVVLKPSPFTPLTQLAYAAMVADAFPPGVFNVISGADAPGQFNVGAFLTSHPDVSLVSFTGSIATGKRIYEASAPDMKRVTLECGGNDAAIVLPDADVAAAAKGVVGSAFANTGQLCCAAKRIFVHESIAEDFKKAAVAAVAATKFDDGFAEGCTHGPLNNKMQFDKVTELVEDAKATGATVLCGGARMGGEHQDGFFFAPTIVADVKEGHRIVDEEQFGPVMPIITYKTEEEALRRANDTKFGLGGSVWGTDLAKANALAARVQAGTVWVNAHSDLTWAPFGGFKWSGIGRELGKADITAFTEIQTLSLAK